MSAAVKKAKGRGQLLHEALTAIGNAASDIATTCNESMFLTTADLATIRARSAAIVQLCDDYEKANTP